MTRALRFGLLDGYRQKCDNVKKEWADKIRTTPIFDKYLRIIFKTRINACAVIRAKSDAEEGDETKHSIPLWWWRWWWWWWWWCTIPHRNSSDFKQPNTSLILWHTIRHNTIRHVKLTQRVRLTIAFRDETACVECRLLITFFETKEE